MTAMPGDDREVLLPGGFTQRLPGQPDRGHRTGAHGRPSSPAVHALLRHLESVGFDGAPRLLGVDERGR